MILLAGLQACVDVFLPASFLLFPPKGENPAACFSPFRFCALFFHEHTLLWGAPYESGRQFFCTHFSQKNKGARGRKEWLDDGVPQRSGLL